MTENTVDTDVYEERHAAALAKIGAALSSAGNTEADEALSAELATLRQEKAELKAELDGLQAQRSKDMAELDDLITQLKPLIGEV